MRGEEVGLTKHEGDEHAQERGVRERSEDDHQRGQCGKKTVYDEDFPDGYDLRTVLDRGDRMPDILHDWAEELRKRREHGADFRDESGKCETTAGAR